MSEAAHQKCGVKEMDDDDLERDLMRSDSDQKKDMEYPSLGRSNDGTPAVQEFNDDDTQKQNQICSQRISFEGSFCGKTGLVSSNMLSSKDSSKGYRVHTMSFGAAEDLEGYQPQPAYQRGTFGQINEEPASTMQSGLRTIQQGSAESPASGEALTLERIEDYSEIQLDTPNTDTRDAQKDEEQEDDGRDAPSFGTSSGEAKQSNERNLLEWSSQVVKMSAEFANSTTERNLQPKKQSNKSNSSSNLNASLISMNIPPPVRPPVQFYGSANAHPEHELLLSSEVGNEALGQQPHFGQYGDRNPPYPSEHYHAQLQLQKEETITFEEEDDERITSVTVEDINSKLQLQVTTSTRETYTRVLNEPFVSYFEEYFRDESRIGLPLTGKVIFERPAIVCREYFLIYFEFVNRSFTQDLLTFMKIKTENLPTTTLIKKQEQNWITKGFKGVSQISQMWHYSSKVIERSPMQNKLYRILEILFAACEKTDTARRSIQKTVDVELNQCPFQRANGELRAKAFALLEWLDSLERGEKNLIKLKQDLHSGTKNQPKLDLYTTIVHNYRLLKSVEMTRSRKELTLLIPRLFSAGY